MLLVSVCERGEAPQGYSTAKNLSEMYRGFCNGLDINKFVSMSNFDLFICHFDLEFTDLLQRDDLDVKFYHPTLENLADSVYHYMRDNLDVYFDIVKSIDEYREKIKNYELDK